MPSDTINAYTANIIPDGESFLQRKRRRTDHGTVSEELTRATQDVSGDAPADPLNVAAWSPRAKYLISKMRLLRFIDESTPSYIIVWLAKLSDKLFIYAGYGRSGDARALLKRIKVGHERIDRVLNTNYADLSAGGPAVERENKEIYWTFASAFLICFFEIKAKKQFSVQYYHPRKLVDQFVKLYPEFSDHDGLHITRLVTYHLSMQVAVSAFSGSASDPSEATALVELVTRMTEGRELALSCSTVAPVTVLGSISTININQDRRVIFEKIYEIKLDPSKYQRGRESEGQAKQVRFAEELETRPCGVDTVNQVEDNGSIAV